eukprot:TRINITY_DN14926_c0_g1_i1.p1 TRINITY_DN14926_c0_g1~~TRINITY_DN14926_c0_g1_i1.p1  ORF type:complete len:560 (+),score=191.37 TRINITY_DN14926_c0_g1_i1:48-1682(+)
MPDRPGLRAVAGLGKGDAVRFVTRPRELDAIVEFAEAVLRYRPANPRAFGVDYLERRRLVGPAEAAKAAAIRDRLLNDPFFRRVQFDHAGQSCKYIARTDRKPRSIKGDPLGSVLDHNLIAQVVWPAAHPFAEWCAGAEGVATLKGKHVLELGSGCGLCGVIAAAHARRVVLSDVDEVSLEMCRCATELPENGSRGLSVSRLRWGNAEQAEAVVADNGGLLFDVVIGADVFYIAKSLQDGLRTAEQVLAPGGVFVCASGVRSDRTEDELMSVPEECGWLLEGGAPVELRTSGTHDEHVHRGSGGVLLYKWRRVAAERREVWWQRPLPNVMEVADPRGGGQTTGLVAFYYAGKESEWDHACGSSCFGNFYPTGLIRFAPPGHEPLTFTNSEAAYQATKHWKHAARFASLDGEGSFQLKRRLESERDGTHAGCGSGWNAMRLVLQQKYFPGSAAADALQRTGDAFLLEHSPVAGRDRVWSDNRVGDGTNWLGLLLMLRRDELGGGRAWTDWIAAHVNLQTGAELAGDPAWRDAVRAAAQVVNQRFD